MDDTAILSSQGNYTTFSFGGKTLTFRTCDGLEKYVKVLIWDKGYIEVLAKYRQRDKAIEEYIDLEPVLNSLYMDKDAFLAPIKQVQISYDYTELQRQYFDAMQPDEFHQNALDYAKKHPYTGNAKRL